MRLAIPDFVGQCPYCEEPDREVYGSDRPLNRRKCSIRFPLLACLLCAWLAGSCCLAVAEKPAGSSPTVSRNFAAEAHARYMKTRQVYRQSPTNAEAAWKFGRACFDWAEYATDKTDRATIADEGITACRKLVARDPQSAAGHYYLAMNLGQLARTKWLGALKLVREMEEEFSAARLLDENLDFAGPDRNLGLLYWQAPSIGSIGDRDKARTHLERAIQLAPAYPENRLNLIEAEMDWHEEDQAQRDFQQLQKLWPQMQKKFSANTWTPSWLDWQKRFNALKTAFNSESERLQSPRQRD